MPEDQKLIGSILSGDECAKRRLYEKYSEILKKLFRRTLSSQDDLVEDLVHDAFEALFSNDYRKLRAWRGESTFKTYLLKITMNVGRDKLRTRVYRPLVAGEEIDPEIGPPDEDRDHNPLANLLRHEVRRAINHCLKKLGVRKREMLFRRHARDERPQFIAEIMGMTANSVSAGLTRAAERMKTCINTQFPGLFRSEEFEPHDMQ